MFKVSSAQGAQSETDPLLPPHEGVRVVQVRVPSDGNALHDGDPDSNGESFDIVPHEKRQLGLASAASLIFNRVIGTGIFATPSVILRTSGSVGVTFIMWLFGAAVAAAGTAVYIELGTGLPRSGGEKVYLEYLYRRPKFLITCAYGVFAVLIGWSSANSVVFGEYTIHALSIPSTTFNTRLTGLLCLTFCFLMHGLFLKTGLRIQNALSAFKLVVLVGIVVSGLCCLAGVPGFKVRPDVDTPHNFDSWTTVWEGKPSGVNSVVTGLYSVIWSYIGYSNANYALSEIRDPIRTIKRAAPLAMASLSAIYLLVNVSYFAAVSKRDILDSGQIVAALYFRNLFGPTTERAFSVVVALSTLGNVLAVMFSHGRVIQELAREGVLPFSRVLASNKPFNAPFAALLVQYIACALALIGPPPGDAYLFILNLSSYPYALINILISSGLLYLSTSAHRLHDREWAPPFRAWTSAIAFFLASNIFLAIIPLVPPAPGFDVYEHLPYWLHVVMAIVIGLLGVLYWFVFFVWLPERGGYKLVREWMLQEDGVSMGVFRKVPL